MTEQQGRVHKIVNVKIMLVSALLILHSSLGFVQHGLLPYRGVTTLSTSASITTEPEQSSPPNPNLILKNIKNMRDLSTAFSAILPNKVVRTGCVSKACPDDMEVLSEKAIAIQTFIDLRSPAELEEDEALHSSPMYANVQDIQFNPSKKVFETSNADISGSKKRYFISIMDESMIKRGVFKRLQKRNKFRSMILLALSKFSRRADKAVRNIFLSYINNGGLFLLNELVVDSSGYALVAVLKLLADSAHYPIAMYCTAGKDRTGILAMLVLALLGASEEEIMLDYSHSDQAYKDLNDNKAMVASLKQADVDPNIFLRANPLVIQHTIRYIKEKYGSIEEYVQKFGFSKEDIDNLRKNLTVAV